MLLPTARACADGRKQRVDEKKGENASPTASTEAVTMTSVTDAKEGRDVATVDMPNAFIQTEQEGVVHMKLKGDLAEVMEMIAPETHTPCIMTEKGVKVLCVQLLNALCGTLKAALSFCKKISEVAAEFGFRAESL